MSDFRAIADRVEIEALRAAATDAAMMRDDDRAASLFTPDAEVRMPYLCRPRTRVRSSSTATPRPAGPTCANSSTFATAGRI